jgi:hypothetical protein
MSGLGWLPDSPLLVVKHGKQTERLMLEGRDWFGADGAKAEDLARLRSVAPVDLPQRYFDLLAASDGGEGPLPVAPFNFCLDSANTVARAIECRKHEQADLEGFIIFGGNGGGEYIAFDVRSGPPWPIVAIDMVAGGETADVISPDFDTFFDQIGIEGHAT